MIVAFNKWYLLLISDIYFILDYQMFVHGRGSWASHCVLELSYREQCLLTEPPLPVRSEGKAQTIQVGGRAQV